jgi:quinol monooxygenase YgiN
MREDRSDCRIPALHDPRGSTGGIHKGLRRGTRPPDAVAICSWFELCQCVDDKTQFILRITWTSVDDHLTGFRKSPEFQEFFGHIRQYVSMIDEMRHYNSLFRSQS